MVALDRWDALLNMPKTLACPRLELIGRDGAAPIVVDTGGVEMPRRLTSRSPSPEPARRR
jgi:hypothetical protein